MIDWAEVRSEFPAVDRRVYLNTAGGAPISRATAAAGRRYYEQSLEDGDVHWDAWLGRVEEVRASLATLLNANAREIAFTANASSGLGLGAQMLIDRGSVLTVRNEFPSCTLPWLQLGFDVRFVPAAQDGAIVVDRLAELMTDATGVLAISSVQYRSGFRHDLEALGSLCREREVVLVVDATQGFGAFPVDVRGSGIGFLAFSGYKWATAGYSVAGLYVAPDLLDRLDFPVAGWRSARDPYALIYDELELTERAAGLEQGHPPFAGIFALGAALETIERLGIHSIAARILELVGYLQRRLEEQGFGILSTTDPRHMSGICVVDVPDARETVQGLAERGILVSSRGRGIRVSLHHYNNFEDIDRFVDALVELRGSAAA